MPSLAWSYLNGSDNEAWPQFDVTIIIGGC